MGELQPLLLEAKRSPAFCAAEATRGPALAFHPPASEPIAFVMDRTGAVGHAPSEPADAPDSPPAVFPRSGTG